MPYLGGSPVYGRTALHFQHLGSRGVEVVFCWSGGSRRVVACSGRSRTGLFVEVLSVPSRLKTLVHHLNLWLLLLVGSGVFLAVAM